MPKMPKPKSKLWAFVESFGGPKPVEIARDEDELIAADYVICVLADDADARRRFPDNVIAFCCDCDVKVQLRPHVPPGPKRICYGCAAKLEGDRQIMVSERTMDEFEAWKRRQ